MTKFLGITVSIAISISTVESALVLLPVAFAQQAPGTPAQAAALFDKAWVLAQQGNHLDAVPIYEAALRILPRSIPGRYYYALSLETFPTKFRDARSEFINVAETAPNSKEGKDARARAAALDPLIADDCPENAYGPGAVARCRRLLSDLPRESPATPNAKLMLANMLIRAKNLSPAGPELVREARSILESLRAARPRWAYALYLLGYSWTLIDDCRAVDFLDSSLAINPKLDLAYGSIAIAHIGCNGARNLKAEIEADRTRRDEFHRDEYSIYR